MILTKDQKTIVTSQCVGMVGSTIFSSGVLLLYSQLLGFSPAAILILLGLPELIGCILVLPSAYYTRKFSIKIFGGIGIILATVGFVILVLAPFINVNQYFLVFLGVILIGIGGATYNGGWMPLIGALIERSTRGRFLGIMRFSWQLFSIGFSFLAMALINQFHGDKYIYGFVISLVVVLQIMRFILYQKIPDKTEKETDTDSLGKIIFGLVKTPPFMSYCCYLFFLTLFTAACPMLINLEQTKFLAFSESQIIFVNTLSLAGGLFGFYIGGIITDRYGTKPLFIMAHFLYGAVLFLFVARDLLIVPPFYSHCVLMLAFGIISAASSIAITTELYDVIPVKNAMISTSFYLVVLSSSKFLAAFVSSQIIKFNLLTNEWSIASFRMNCFDTMLIGCAGMVLLLVMTLGLIPSVQKGNQQ